MNEHRLFADPKLTAYALGELQGQERATIEAALRDDPAAQAVVEEIRAFAQQMSEALAHEPTPAPSTAVAPDDSVEPEIDRTLLAEYPAKGSKLLRFPQLYFLIGGLAAACVAVMVSLREEKPIVPPKHYEVVALTPYAGGSAKNPNEATADEASSAPASTEDSGAASRDAAWVHGEAARLASSARETLPVSVPPAAAATYLTDNAFVPAAQTPWSTFAIGVDTASYSTIRRYIESGRLPPADAVRIEELLNYFPYEYAEVKSTGVAPAANAGVGGDHAGDGAGPVAATLEVASAPWASDHRLVRIGLKARDVAAAPRGPANLVFLLDVSGSMDEPNKLPLVKQAVRSLVDHLLPEDRVAIVTYAGNSGLALPSTPVTRAREILAALDGLTASGSTNGSLGIQLAYDIAKSNFVSGGVNRVILCTDGDFNVGVTGQRELTELVEDKAKTGVALSVLGFGMSSKDSTLEFLADKGHGSYGYIDTRREAEKMLARQVNPTIVAAAKDVKVQVEFNPARVASYRLIGYEDRLRKVDDFDDDTTGVVDLGPGDAVTALYEVIPVAAERKNPVAGADQARYQTLASGALGSSANELLTLKVRCKEPTAKTSERREFALVDRGQAFAEASRDFKFAAAVAEFGMILRDSPYRGKATIGDVLAWAASAATKSDDDPRGYRSDFLDLLHRAKTLMQ